MCPYLAAWSLDPVVQMVSPHVFLDVVVHERSLSRGLPFTCPPPEQYFNPTTYNFGRFNTTHAPQPWLGNMQKCKLVLASKMLLFEL